MRSSKETGKKYLLDPPLPQRLDRRLSGASSRDNRIKDNSDITRRGVLAVGRLDTGREVIIVLDGLQGRLLAEETEMVHRDRNREERLES